jgi:putative ABC transport system permease protein
MRRLVLAGVRHNRARYVATLVAIMTGVAFFTATGFVSNRVIQSLEGDVDQQYGAVGVAIVAEGDSRPGAQDAETKLTEVTAARLRQLPGVDGAAGSLKGRVAFKSPAGKPFAKEAVGRLAVTDGRLDPLDYTEGRAPRRAGEIALDRGLAADHGLELGRRETLLTLAGAFPVRVVGITRFGSSDALDPGGTVVLPAATAFDWLNSGQREYDEYYLRVDGDEEPVVASASQVLPAAFEAQTGSDFRDDKRSSVGAVGRYLKSALQGFALLALLIGGFVIFNTFSVIVAQRMRELAVLAAIGATPKQLKRSLRLEGLVIGLVGSALGVLAGVAMTLVLMAVLRAVGVELPGSGIAITPGAVLGGMLLGTAITVASVSIPARRAARTDPMDALRQAATESGRPSRRRGGTAAALAGVGVLGLVAGQGAAAVGAGGLAFVAAVLVGAPYLALAGAKTMRPVLSRFGLEGRLAADNAARNPRRTATTANALLIGVFLVTLVVVSGTSVRDFAVGELNKLSGADYLLVSEGGSIDPGLVGDIEGIDGISRVVPFRNEPVTIAGRRRHLSTGDVTALRNVADLDVAKGSLDRFGPGQIAVVDDGTGKTPRVGEDTTVADGSGQEVRLRVATVLEGSIDASAVGALVAPATFEQLVGDVAPTVAFVDLADGEQTAARSAVQRRVDLRPDITLEEGNAVARVVGQVLDFMIDAVVGLLLMSVVIALIGIVNTLSLSILERRRELGLLRIVGMTDDRVGRMVRLESLLIAGLGTVGGLATGLFVAITMVASINRLAGSDIALSVPYLELLGVLVAGVVLGLMAALLPARRSTRIDVLEAVGAV